MQDGEIAKKYKRAAWETTADWESFDKELSCGTKRLPNKDLFLKIKRFLLVVRAVVMLTTRQEKK